MSSGVNAPEHTHLVRAIGRWGLAALVINSIIGSGIFGLPAIVAAYLGRESPFAYLVAAAGIGIVMGCFAEVASQFRQAGGPYLYTRAAFGRLLALEVAWLHWLSRLTAAAAAMNLFATYLGFFWPSAQRPTERALLAAAILLVITGVNLLGVRIGAHLSSAFTIAKITPLLLFAAVGLLYSFAHPAVSPVNPHATTAADWFGAFLVLIFAYGGFEGALVPMSEARDPRRDVPFAMGIAFVSVTLIYVLVQIVVVRVLADPSQTDRPLAMAAQVFLGRGGAGFIAVSALLALFGYLSAQMVHVPRITFALAEQGDLPPAFAAIHNRFRTPHVSILVFTISLWLLTVIGNFRANVVLSSASRLITYGLVCASLLALRRNRPEAAAYRLPRGRVFAVIGIALMIVLFTRISWEELAWILATAVVAFLHWLATRRHFVPAQSLSG
jgi:basic amino acid/polyamine antiporter, APA family